MVAGDDTSAAHTLADAGISALNGLIARLDAGQAQVFRRQIQEWLSAHDSAPTSAPIGPAELLSELRKRRNPYSGALTAVILQNCLPSVRFDDLLDRLHDKAGFERGSPDEGQGSSITSEQQALRAMINTKLHRMKQMGWVKFDEEAGRRNLRVTISPKGETQLNWLRSNASESQKPYFRAVGILPREGNGGDRLENGSGGP